jgi:hypothetical protein
VTLLAPGPVRVAQVTSPAPRAAWQAVVATDPDSMVDQSPEWMAALVATSPWTDASRLYELEDGRRFVLPLARRRGLLRGVGVEASMPDGWGIGGIVGAGRDRAVVAAVLDDLRGRPDVFTRVRPDPLDAELWADHGGVTTKPRHAHVLDLRGGLEAVAKGLHRSVRRNIRQAEAAGLDLTFVADRAHLRAYYDLFELSIARWAEGSREPLALAQWRARRRDPLDKLEALADHLGDRFRLRMAWKDGVAIAGSITLHGNAAHVTRGAMDKEPAHRTRAMTLLDWVSIQDALADGCPSYHFGETGTSTSLAKFKESFGARPHAYADVRVERLPVTRVDAALRTGVKRVIGFRDGS